MAITLKFRGYVGIFLHRIIDKDFFAVLDRMLLCEIELTCTKVPFVAMEAGGLKNSLIDGNKTCWIDHSRWAHAVSASESSSCSISSSIVTSSSGTTTKLYKIGALYDKGRKNRKL